MFDSSKFRLCLLLATMTVLNLSTGMYEKKLLRRDQRQSKYSIAVPEMKQEQLQTMSSYIQAEWSEWSEWSQCSRSCGGGVRSQIRECLKKYVNTVDSNVVPVLLWRNKSNCHGSSIRSHMCNDHECPHDQTADFRKAQCEMFNSKPFSGVYYNWEPYVKGENQCVLNCKPVGYKFYATLNTSVIDGTSCTLEASERSLCVRGICKTVGCDGVINGQRYDACGRCGGDNSTCRLISGLYTKPHLSAGYNYIAEIPRQACNLSVSEIKKTNNLLALRYKNGSYILNGDWIADKPGSYEAAGTWFNWVKGDNKSSDTITAFGPLLQPLDLLLLYRQTNLGIKYEYRLPASYFDVSVKEPSARSVPLIVPVGSPISSFQYSGQVSEVKPYYNDEDEEADRVRKLKIGFNDVVHNNSASSTSNGSNSSGSNIDLHGLVRDEESKPKSKFRKKKFIWKISGYTPCSKTCGSGVQTAVISCVKEGNQIQIVQDKRCSNQDRPPIVQPIGCILSPCPAKWVLSDWSSCSVTCGEGVETRNLSCKREISQDSSIVVPDDACLSSPSVNILRTRPCFKQACPTNSIFSNNSELNTPSDNTDFKPYWHAGSWSPCSAKCGIGVRVRKTLCISAGTNQNCDPNERPAEQVTCDAGTCGNSSITYSWFTTPWTEPCSETCGTGIQTRKLYCSAGPDLDSFCDADSKPEIVRSCTSEKTCGGQWFSGPWSQCSERCGWGKQQRIVICVASDKLESYHRVVNNVSCTEIDKPSMEQACFEKPCSTQWFEGSWSACSRKCDSGIQRKEVRCLNVDLQESSECAENEKPATRRSCNTHKCSSSYNNNKDLSSEETYTEQSHSTTQLTVIDNKDSQIADENCKDKYSKCNLVVRARLCSSQYYQSSCCFSCRKAANVI